MKQKLHRLLRPAAIGLAVLGALGLLAFSAHRTGSMPVKALKVVVDAPMGVHFIDDNTVRRQVLAASGSVMGAPAGAVDLVAIEQGLAGLGCVAGADVYHTMDGVLHVTVRQREPIVRVINADGTGFYIDRDGWTMPLSPSFTARVLVVTGALAEPFAQRAPVELPAAPDSVLRSVRSEEILALATVVAGDPVWNALFDQAVVDADGEFELIPRVGGQRVKVGRMTGTSPVAETAQREARELLRERLAKLRAFYAHGIPQSDWRMYATIDTRFAGQVVCTRRDDGRVPSASAGARTGNNITANQPKPGPR